MSLTSYLYECQIAHARTKPRSHAFLHKHFMMYIDLNEVETLHSRLRCFSGSKYSLYRFLPADHLPGLGEPDSSLRDRVVSFAAAHGVNSSIDRIRLLTNVRFLGYVFNPVSFFFCFDAAEQPVCCVVEVGNTFGEKKAYFLNVSSDRTFRDRQQKLFYVSPFTELCQEFLFDLQLPAENLSMRIDTIDGDERVVSTSVQGNRLAFTEANLLQLTLRYPWATARVIMLIHFQALVLWLKGTPFHKKEEAIEQQSSVLNPHHSLESVSQR